MRPGGEDREILRQIEAPLRNRMRHPSTYIGITEPEGCLTMALRLDPT
jgi:hypothetical protein